MYTYLGIRTLRERLLRDLDHDRTAFGTEVLVPGDVGRVAQALDGEGAGGGLQVRGETRADNGAEGACLVGAPRENECHALAARVVEDVVGGDGSVRGSGWCGC